MTRRNPNRTVPTVTVEGTSVRVMGNDGRMLMIACPDQPMAEHRAAQMRGMLADAFHAGMQEEQRRVERTHEDGHYTIQTDDIGRGYIEAFGKSWSLANVIGRVQPDDVGKRIFYRGGVVQVENDQQRLERLARAAGR